LAGKHVSALAAMADGRVLAGTHADGLFRSRDDGRTWEPSTNGFSHQQVYSLAIAREPAGEVLYTGTEPVSLYRSTDGGDRWQELPAIARVPGAETWTFPPPPHEAHTKALTVDRARPTTLYAAIEQGALLKSADAGASWTEIEGFARGDDQVYRDVHRLLQAPWDRELLFLATGDGFSRSTDGGRTWEQSAALKRHIGYPDAMVVSPREDRTLLVAGARGNPGDWFQTGAAEGTLYRSRDGGQTWEPANAGLPQGARSNLEAMTLVAHPGGLSLFVGSTDGDYFASDDLGDSWSTIATGIAPVSKAGHHAMLRMFSSMPARLRPAFAFTSAAVLGVTSRVAAARRAARTKRARASA
jgi:photosystem II stability/assembly factor-like uncharacterized protein